MKNSRKLLSILVLFIMLGCEKNNKNIQQLVAINPLSYTDVAFSSIKDTVFVSTYSGRISKRIKEQDKEELLIQLKDEVYSLQYSDKQNLVIASTLKSGILFIDVHTGEIKKNLQIKKDTWLNSIFLSKDDNYLIGFDTKGNNHIWDLNNDYKKLDFKKELPNSFIRYVDKLGAFYYQTQGKYIKWNPTDKRIEKEYKISGKLVDINDNGDFLLLNFNEFRMFNSKADSLEFKNKHPYYIYKYSNGDTVHDPYQLKLTAARFTMDKIYTSSLDQSIRVWNKIDGTLIDEWYLHNATISDIDISKNQKQLVSVDLKGEIRFWDLK